MKRESFEQEILRELRRQISLRPGMGQEDLVKHVFQAMLGPGHLLSARENVTQYIEREMEQIPAEDREPLTEKLSPAYCRLNLRSAKAKGIPASVIAGLMMYGEAPGGFTREDVLRFCEKLAGSGESLFQDRMTNPEELGRIREENWLPSHSALYREKYFPAYRVIPSGWIPCMEIFRRIAEIRQERMLITLDGPCASGKTTLAEKLAGVLEAPVVHTDEYVVPHARKTAERLAVPGGNCDAGRLEQEVASPWKQGKTVRYRRYDCRKDCLLPEEELPEGRILILEGSYSNVPEIRRHADLRIFVTASRETREKRLEKRESEASLQRFHEMWIPLEDRYFEAFGLPDGECIVIREEQGEEETDGN